MVAQSDPLPSPDILVETATTPPRDHASNKKEELHGGHVEEREGKEDGEERKDEGVDLTVSLITSVEAETPTSDEVGKLPSNADGPASSSPDEDWDAIRTPPPALREDANTDSELSALASTLAIAPPPANADLTPSVVEPDDFRPPTPVKDPTLKPLVASPPPPSPPPKDVPPKDLPPKDLPRKSSLLSEVSPNGRIYLDQPPVTPHPSRPSSPLPGLSVAFGGATTTGKSQPSSDDENDGTQSVIHDLFEKSHRASMSGEQLQRIPSVSSVSSPMIASPPLHPPRSSSLSAESGNEPDYSPPPPAAEGSELSEKSPLAQTHSGRSISSISGNKATPHRPPPPDEDLPFDFHRFLSQLRHRSADPVAKFLRSFLQEFAKKQWMVHEQVKIIRDFLTFIYAKMDLCEVWREVGDGEMDNAMEGMEKLVMNRLYTQTFSPEIPLHDGKARFDERFPGRRGQHQEDVERDSILAQKVRIYSWVREEHLDIGDTVSGEGGRRFLDLAVKEMLKMGSYRAPRDKVICVLNCCKVIFGLLRHSKSEESADKFVPLLIYVVLRANPEHLVSNVQYILRFRNPDKLSGEAGYYLSSLMGAIQFIENLDRASLTISAEEFERNVEAAVAEIAERPPPPSPPPKPRRSTEQRDTRPSRENTDPEGAGEEKAAVAGLLRTLQKPLTTIGRIFTDDGSSSSHGGGPAVTPQPGNTPRHSPNPDPDDALLTAVGGRRHQQNSRRRLDGGNARLSAEEAAARQASAETEEAARIGRMEYEHVVETLMRMFPDLDRDVVCDVVNMKKGQVGAAVDACLALCTS